MPVNDSSNPFVSADERRQAIQERRDASAISQPAPMPASGSAPLTEEQLLQQEIDRFNAIQNDILLTRVTTDLGDVDAAVNALPANIAALRSRGYVFKNYLERKADTLATQWRDLRPGVEAAIQTQSQQLRMQAEQVQMSHNRGQRATAAMSALESEASAAQRSLQGMYDPLNENVLQTQKQLDDIVWTLQQAEQASFGMLATEAPVEAVPANWSKPGHKDGMGGVLYLTDQRLVFEQKEEVATKKVLFIATEKKMVQALGWEVPVANIATATGSHRGFMNKDDFLTINCAPGSGIRTPEGTTYPTADIHLKGETGDAWQGFIGRVKTGDVAKERTVPVDEKAAAAVANAPTKCGTCGATITQPILRGQTEITCQYCGSVIRVE
jgi:hypothetical protein